MTIVPERSGGRGSGRLGFFWSPVAAAEASLSFILLEVMLGPWPLLPLLSSPPAIVMVEPMPTGGVGVEDSARSKWIKIVLDKGGHKA